MVKAHYYNNLDEYKKFGIFHTIHARLANILLISILFFIFGVGMGVLGIMRSDAGIITCAIVCVAFAIGYPFFNCLVQVSKIKKNVSQNKNFTQTQQFFVFSEDGLSLQIRVGARSSDYEIPYNQIFKAFETNTNFYVYIGRQQALIINKNDIDEGNVEQLCSYLRTGLGKRFSEKKSLRK